MCSSTNVNSGRCHSVYKLLIKEREKILPAKCPAYFVHTSKELHSLLTCDIELVIIKVLGHFLVFPKLVEALNKSFSCMEMEEGCHRYTYLIGRPLLLAIGKI